MSALGCNRNLLVENDFSYSPAHGIEMTFSEGNQLVRNRLFENAICGVWGGYSSGTVITRNEFNGNGGMAYGLERGGINMEHAADNLILRNRFVNNKCAIHLWWNHNAALMKLPGVAGTERGVTGNVIANNHIEINRNVPFKNLRPDAKLIALQLRDSDGAHVTNNSFFDNSVILTHPQAVKFAVKPGCEPRTEGRIPAFRIPAFNPLGQTRPIGKRQHLRGRDQIIMDEWGPWDHESPLLRPSKGVADAVAYDVFGLKRALRVEVLEGKVISTIEAGKANEPIRVTLQARSGVTAYRAKISAGDFQKEIQGTIIAVRWQVKFFPWKVDPRENLPAWRELANTPDAVAVTASALDFPFGFGGPRDLKLSEELRKRGPGSDHFGLIARTDLKLPKGRWRFRTLSDDGIRVVGV